MKFFPLVFLATVSVALSQTDPAEQSQAPAAAKTTISKPVLPGIEALRLAGFPVDVLKLEPALAAAFELTPEQQQEVKKAWDETVEQVKKDMEGNGDKKQIQAAVHQAKKEFESRRSMILTDRQLSLAETIRREIRAAHVEIKEAKSPPAGVKQKFLEKMKVALSAEQLALVQAAGGNLP